MVELPEEIDRLIQGFSQRVFDWTKFLTTESAENMASAKTSLREAIFDELVLQREMGREEGYEEWDDDDPVGRFIKQRHDAENVIDPNWVNPFVIRPDFLAYLDETETPFITTMLKKVKHD